MAEQDPVSELCAQFSSPGAQALAWARAVETMAAAEVFWLSTVRPDGCPHVTPLLGVWTDRSFWFCTGPEERKARNLAMNPSCVATTGRNGLDGLDIVIEGDAGVVDDPGRRETIADAFELKYGPHFTAPEGTWAGLGDAMRSGDVLVFRTIPSVVLGFAKGDTYSQTRWTFDHDRTATSGGHGDG